MNKRRLRITSTFTSSLFSAEKERNYENNNNNPSTSKSQVNGQNGVNEVIPLR